MDMIKYFGKRRIFMSEKTKKLGEIFSDYKTESNIKNAEIEAMNVSKKTNNLGIILHANKYIEIKEIYQFENFLKNRFNFSTIDTKIKYKEGTELKSIQEEWVNIVCYIAHKFPSAKDILLKSNVEESEDKIVVNIHIPGKDFLKIRKVDKEIQKVILSLFGKK